MPGRTARVQYKGTPQVDLKRLPPVVGIGGGQRAYGAELARVAGQQIYRPDRLLDRGDHALDLLAAGDIAPYGERAAATICDLTGDTGDIVLGARAESHRGTCVTQGQGDGSADARGLPP